MNSYLVANGYLVALVWAIGSMLIAIWAGLRGNFSTDVADLDMPIFLATFWPLALLFAIATSPLWIGYLIGAYAQRKLRGKR